tara:strand:+ start:1996 stop:2406 length:411 start_codon:yes stop_codon:yes gene_type:complete
MHNIFANEHNESPAAILRQTMSVSLADDGTPVVSFATNRGKGSGAQVIPVSEFAEYVSTLEDILDSGIPEDADEDVSAGEMVRRTIRQEDGVISFRVRGGKGAKPAKVSADNFAEVVELLRSTVDAVENASETLEK